jgi:hypothetical protein
MTFHIYYTKDFESIGHDVRIAVCLANNPVEAQTILRVEIIKAGCRDPSEDFKVTQLSKRALVLNGDY